MKLPSRSPKRDVAMLHRIMACLRVAKQLFIYTPSELSIEVAIFHPLQLAAAGYTTSYLLDIRTFAFIRFV